MIAETLSAWRKWWGGGAHAPQKHAEHGSDPQERRLWDRFQSEFHTHVRLADDASEMEIPAVIKNISVGGVNLVVDTALYSGQVVHVELPALEAGETHTATACVVRVHQAVDEKWTLGCVFSQELTEQELAVLAGWTPATPDADVPSRAFTRFDCNVEAAVCRVGDPPDKSIPVRVVNVSNCGMGIIGGESLDPGIVMDIVLRRAGADERAISILGCVVHATRKDSGETLAGCNFIRELTEDELSALL